MRWCEKNRTRTGDQGYEVCGALVLWLRDKADAREATALDGSHHLRHTLVAHVAVSAQMHFRLRLLLRGLGDVGLQRGLVDRLVVPTNPTTPSRKA